MKKSWDHYFTNVQAMKNLIYSVSGSQLFNYNGKLIGQAIVLLELISFDYCYVQNGTKFDI